MIQKQEAGKSIGPLTALKRMVTMPRKLNMDHLKSHLNIGAKKENGKKWNTQIQRSQEKMKEVLWYFMYIK
jgi:hypothetical protein